MTAAPDGTRQQNAGLSAVRLQRKAATATLLIWANAVVPGHSARDSWDFRVIRAMILAPSPATPSEATTFI